MFVRNGQALGSVLHSADPGASRPKKRKPKADTKPVTGVTVEYVGYVEPEGPSTHE